MMSENETPEARAERFRELHAKLRAEVGKVIVGHERSLSHMLTALFAMFSTFWMAWSTVE